jgi:hypothetical protein
MYDEHRCITIGSLVAKVLSMLIDKRLTGYLEDNGLRSIYQGGCARAAEDAESADCVPL